MVLMQFIKQIPVNVGFGDVVYYQSAAGLDFRDCSRQTLSHISFRLKDAHGNATDLKGAHISLSIVFSRVQDGGYLSFGS